MQANIKNVLIKILPQETAFAHCDVPCGIYDPKPAQIAAATVLKMVELIITPAVSFDQNDQTSIRNYHNAMTRYVITKEEHAQKCKEEILILWTDYFKKEHLSLYPNLHDLFWETAKLCSYNKQHVDLDKAKELMTKVDEIAKIFTTSKQQ